MFVSNKRQNDTAIRNQDYRQPELFLQKFSFSYILKIHQSEYKIGKFANKMNFMLQMDLRALSQVLFKWKSRFHFSLTLPLGFKM